MPIGGPSSALLMILSILSNYCANDKALVFLPLGRFTLDSRKRVVEKGRLRGVVTSESHKEQQQFEAVLESGGRALGWTIARVPFDPAVVWPKMIRLRVRGEMNGFALRTSLFPDPARPGMYFLLVNREVQKGGHVTVGGSGRFSLQPDMDERPADLPDELAALLDEEDGLRAWYDGLSEYTRREIGKWIIGVKSDDARMRRCEQMAERLMSAMEGERELPPVIAAAFRKRPKARAGWDTMTPTQRRNELMAVFYYQSPEAREKRVAKLCDEAEKRARAESDRSAVC